MPKVKNICPDLKELEKMGKDYGVYDLAVFRSALFQYSVQLEAIKQINEAVKANDAVVKKTYIKGNDNEYMHPALRELPKHCDSANKTVNTLLDIMTKLGQKPQPDELMEFLKK